MSGHGVTPTDVRPARELSEDTATSLAFEIADEAALSEVEGACALTCSGDHNWYDPATASLQSWAAVDRAIRYLELRGPDLRDVRMVRSPVFPRLVRFEAQP